MFSGVPRTLPKAISPLCLCACVRSEPTSPSKARSTLFLHSFTPPSNRVSRVIRGFLHSIHTSQVIATGEGLWMSPNNLSQRPVLGLRLRSTPFRLITPRHMSLTRSGATAGWIIGSPCCCVGCQWRKRTLCPCTTVGVLCGQICPHVTYNRRNIRWLLAQRT
jgi:hypothetical protein